MTEPLPMEWDEKAEGSILDPQKNIIPAADSDMAEIISTEANYDRWSPFLFPHSKSPDI